MIYEKSKYGDKIRVEQQGGYTIIVKGVMAFKYLMSSYKLTNMNINIHKTYDLTNRWFIHIMDLDEFESEDELRTLLESITDNCVWAEDFY